MQSTIEQALEVDSYKRETTTVYTPASNSSSGSVTPATSAMKHLNAFFCALWYLCTSPCRIEAQIGYPPSPVSTYSQNQNQNQHPYDQRQQQPYFQYSSPNSITAAPTYPVTLGIPRDNALLTPSPILYNSNSVGPSSCRGQLVGDELKYVCTGPSPTLSRKYILWLQAGRTRPVRIEIPNYKLDDWIEAGFKRSPDRTRSLINVFVRKPEVTAHASAEETTPQEPDVNLEYEPVLQTTRHFGTDEVRIVGPGVIQEPQAFGGTNDGRQQIQYKRDVKSVKAAAAAENGGAKREELTQTSAPSPNFSTSVANQNQTQAYAFPMPMWSGMWIPISGPNGERIKLGA